jgi:hypothetical protein
VIYPQENWVPQGSVLNVILFAVAFNGMVNMVGLSHCHCMLLHYPEHGHYRTPATSCHESCHTGSAERLFFLHSKDPVCTLLIVVGFASSPQSVP